MNYFKEVWVEGSQTNITDTWQSRNGKPLFRESLSPDDIAKSSR